MALVKQRHSYSTKVRMTIRLVSLWCLAALSGCSGTSSDHTTVIPHVNVVANAAQLHVVFVVITDQGGNGNPLWTRPFMDRLLGTVSQNISSAVQFVLIDVEVVRNDTWFAMNQGPLLLDSGVCFAQRQSTTEEGVVTVIISNPTTSDAAGKSIDPYTARKWWRSNPCFVMRARSTLDTEATRRETAAIFLHELGRNIGFGDQPDPFDPLAVPLTNDSYWLDSRGHAVIQDFAAFLAQE